MVQCPNCDAIFRIELDGRILEADTVEGDAAAEEIISDHEVPESFSESELQGSEFGDFEALDAGLSQDYDSRAEYQDENPNPLSVTAYAESPISDAREGPYLYRLQIDGLDTQELLQDFRRVLEGDPKFGLDADLILSQVAQGRLRIDGLNPAKAAILVQRLRVLPVKVSWEQYAYYEADSK